jgi:PAS domain S-box-containing protein
VLASTRGPRYRPQGLSVAFDRADEQASLRRVATLVARRAPTEEVCAAVAEEAGKLLGAEMANTYRFEDDTHAVLVGAWSKPGIRSIEDATRLRLDGRTAVPLVFRRREAVRVDDYSEIEGSLAAFPRERGIRSTVAAPIFVDEELWGALTASRTGEEPMPEAIERQLADFAELVSQSLANHEAHRLLREEHDLATGVIELSQALIIVFDRDGRIVLFNRASERASGYTAGELLGRDARETLVPLEEAERFARVLERSFEAGESSEIRGSWLSKDGSRRTIEFSNRPLADATGKIRHLLTTGLDVTESERATEQIVRLASEQSALRRVATLVARTPKPEQVFQAVAEEAGRMLGADSATIRFDGETGVTVGRWNVGPMRGFEVGSTVPLSDSDALTAVVARTGQPARIDDYSVVRGEAAETMHQLGYRSGLAAPIIVEGHTWGTLLVASSDTEPFDPDAEHRLVDFTELVTLALESAHARTELTASRARIVSAGDAERKRLERNLHDGAQQRLVALSVQLRVAQSRLRSDPDEAETLIADAADKLQLALEELRELAHGLHPPGLTERGLGPTLEALAERAPFPVEITGAEQGRLPEHVEAALYYVAAESVTNAAKHGSPSFATIELGISEDSAWIEVADDGSGGATLGSGSGLQGLADRIATLGGRFTLTSPPGNGTRVRAELPLHRLVQSVVPDA